MALYSSTATTEGLSTPLEEAEQLVAVAHLLADAGDFGEFTQLGFTEGVTGDDRLRYPLIGKA